MTKKTHTLLLNDAEMDLGLASEAECWEEMFGRRAARAQHVMPVSMTVQIQAETSRTRRFTESFNF